MAKALPGEAAVLAR